MAAGGYKRSDHAMLAWPQLDFASVAPGEIT